AHVNQRKIIQEDRLNNYKISLTKVSLELEKMNAMNFAFKKYTEIGKRADDTIDWGLVNKHVHNHKFFKIEIADLMPIFLEEGILTRNILNCIQLINTINSAYSEYNNLHEDFDAFIGSEFTYSSQGKIINESIK